MSAIDADTKLVPCWRVGSRDGREAYYFIKDLAFWLTNGVQLTTDGLKAYLEAIEEAFGCEIDYAMLIKLYGSTGAREGSSAARSPCARRSERRSPGFIKDRAP